MTSDWLPVPAAWVLSVVFVVIAAVHLRHQLHSSEHHDQRADQPVDRQTDERTDEQTDEQTGAAAGAGAPPSVRAWHAGHVVMAVGMVLMLLPIGLMPSSGVAVPVFTVLAVASAAAAAVIGLSAQRRAAGRADGADQAADRAAGGRRWAACWAVLAVDLAAMAYMWTVTTASPAWLTVAVVAWLAAEAALWGAGLLSGRAATPRGEVETWDVVDPRDTVPDRATDRQDAHQSVSAGAARGGATAADGPRPDASAAAHDQGAPPTSSLSPPLSGAVAVAAATQARGAHLLVAHPGLRLSMVAMALGMGYMLASMQFGHMTMGAGMGGHHH